MVSAFRILAKANWLQRIYIGYYGVVLILLVFVGRNLGFQEIANALGEGFDAARIFPQMGFVDGVLFPKSEPAGLRLTKS